MSGRARQTCIAGHKRGVEGFGERDISSVVRGQVRAWLPDAGQQQLMVVGDEVEIGQTVQRDAPSMCSDRGVCNKATKSLGNLQQEQVRGV